MKQVVIVLVVLLAFIQKSVGQVLTVLNAQTNRPIVYASVLSNNPKASVITNAEGKAEISQLSGSTAIEIRSVGFRVERTSYKKLEANEFNVLLEPSNLLLDEVVIAGTRWRESSRNLAVKVTSISAEQVQLQNPQTAADLLETSGKVYVQKSQQGGGSPMIRGFAANRLLYTVDGVRMNTAIFRSGNLQNVINIDPFAVSQTDVVFGPGSVIYGSDAIGAVMNFQTIEPAFSFSDNPLISGKVIARYSSANNEQTGHFDLNVGWKKWAMVTSFSQWDFDHLRQGQFGPEDYLKGTYVQRQDGVDQIITQEDELIQRPSAYSQTNLMQKIRFRPNKSWDFQYGFHYSETSPYGRYDRHNRERNGAARYAEWDYGPQSWMMNLFTITHMKRVKLYDEAAIRLAHQGFAESRISRDLNDPIREIQKERVDAYSLNIDFVKDVGENLTLFYGAEGVFNDVTSKGSIEDISTQLIQDGPSRYPTATWSSYAAYLSSSYTLSSKLTLQGGVRYNQYALSASFDTTFYPFPFTNSDLNDGALTGSAGLVYRPFSTWQLTVNAGSAFRSPNVDDIGKVFDSEPGSIVVPNPNLDAEYAYNLDIGVAKRFGDRAKLSLTGYYTLLNNALVRRDYQLAGRDSLVYDGVLSQVQAIQNAAEAYVYGAQAGLEIRLLAGFGFETDLNYQVGKEELADGSTSPSRHVAPFFGVSRVTFRKGKLEAQVYSRFQGERSFNNLSVSERTKDEIYAKDAAGNNYAPSWYTLNIKAKYQVAESLLIATGIENITDQRYRPYSSGLSGPGRNFIMSVNVTF